MKTIDYVNLSNNVLFWLGSAGVKDIKDIAITDDNITINI